MFIPNNDNLINKKKLALNSYVTCLVKVLGCDMLLKSLIYYDKVYLYAKNIDQVKYQLLANELNILAKKKIHVKEIYKYSNNEIKNVVGLENKLQK